MTWLDHGRRAVTVLLVAIVLLTVPAVAEAGFSSRQRTEGLTASTARLVAPTEVTGTYRCGLGFFTESFDVTVASFVDSGPAGATYRYSLQRGDRVVRTSTSTSRSVSVGSGNLLIDGTSTQWTLSVQAVLGSWTGPTYTRTVTCGVFGNGSGQL